MKTGKAKPSKFRVKDWVSFIDGYRFVLAQILEDRGPLGVRGRRLYTIRLDRGPEEPSTFTMPEDELRTASKEDQIAWCATRSVGVQQVLSYRSKEDDPDDRSRPLYHYLVVAKPGPQAGSATATIFLLSGERAVGVSEESLPTLHVSSGGPEAARAKAEAYLDAQHAGLKKWASDPMR